MPLFEFAKLVIAMVLHNRRHRSVNDKNENNKQKNAIIHLIQCASFDFTSAAFNQPFILQWNCYENRICICIENDLLRNVSLVLLSVSQFECTRMHLCIYSGHTIDSTCLWGGQWSAKCYIFNRLPFSSLPSAWCSTDRRPRTFYWTKWTSQ